MKKKNRRDRELKNSEIFPLAMILGFVPLLFRVIPHFFTPDEKTWIVGTVANDLYSIVKVRALLVFTVIALGIFLYQVAKKRIHIEKSPYLIGAGIYILAILLSTLTSSFDTAVWGFNDRFEGMWVLLAYVTIFIIGMHYGRQENTVKKLTTVFLASTIVMSTIGLMQYFGHDPFTAGVLRYLSFPSQAWDSVASSVRTSFQLGIVGSLYNPNFMGSYAAMAMLLSLGRLLEQNKSQKEAIFLWVANLMAFAALVGSRSSAGLLGLIVGLVLMVLFVPKAFQENKKKLGILLVSWASITVGLMVAYATLWEGSRLIQDDYLVLCVYLIYFLAAAVLYRMVFNSREKNKQLIAITLVFGIVMMTGAGFLYSPVESVVNRIYDKGNIEEKEEERPNLQEILFEGDQVTLTEKDGKAITFSFAENQLQALDGEGNNLEIQPGDPGHYEVVGKGYEEYKLVMTKLPDMDDQFYVVIPKFDLWVMLTDMGVVYKGRNHLPASVDNPPSIGFEGKENFATRRGYIWSRTLPLMKKYAIIGAGPDCFVHVFPQYEHITKWNIGVNPYLLYDKPHNWYLQMAINTGGISMLTVLFMGLFLLIQSIKKFMLKDEQKILPATLVALVFAYAFAGVFNDSVVSVAPIFWIFFGLSVGAVNGLMPSKKANKKHK